MALTNVIVMASMSQAIVARNHAFVMVLVVMMVVIMVLLVLVMRRNVGGSRQYFCVEMEN